MHIMPELKMEPPKPKAEFKLCEDCNGYGYSLKDDAIRIKSLCTKCHGTGKIKNYRPRTVKGKQVSVQLHKFTKLTKDQLKRLEQMGGNGAHAKYTADGNLSLELVRRVELAKRKQPKFVLYSSEHGRELFIADRDLVKIEKEKSPLTTNIKEALTFIEGFDDENTKIQYFSGLTKLKLMSKRV